MQGCQSGGFETMTITGRHFADRRPHTGLVAAIMAKRSSVSTLGQGDEQHAHRPQRFPIRTVSVGLHLLRLAMDSDGGGRPVVELHGRAGWQPRGKSVTVERVTTVGGTGKKYRRCLAGSRPERKWLELCCLRSRPDDGRELYRLSAWVRVDRVGPARPCPISNASSNRPTGNAISARPTPRPTTLHS